MISPKLLVYAALAIALLGVGLWVKKIHYEATVKLPATIARAKQAEASIAALEIAREHERKISKDASDEFHRNVKALKDELASRPIGPVIVRVPVRARGSVPATTTASERADATSPGREPATVEVDIERPITAYGFDCARTAEQLTALQSWVRSR